MPSDRGSRLLDLALCLPLVLLSLPVMGLIALAVRFDSPGPVLYRETRAGRDGRPFLLPKFRTLRAGQSHSARVVPADDAAVTRLGRFLRRSRLDELPQLFEVLAGRMRLVGPRPERPQVWTAIDPVLRRRVLAVPPGMTSPASLSHLCEDAVLADFEEPERLYREVLFPLRVTEDLRYLESRTPASDLRVLGRTLLLVLGNRDDASCRRRLAAALRQRQTASTRMAQ